jgi:long-chain acyl-CoA synthetase
MDLKQLLELPARELPGKTALILNNRRISYRELDETANQIANVLIDGGLIPGEHVAILMSHSPEWVSHYFGIIKAGGVAILLSPALKAPELRALLLESDTKVLVTETIMSRILLNHDPLLGETLQIRETDSSSYLATLSASSTTPPDIEINRDAPATIIYTSGVLGRQKGVVHTHASLLGTPRIISAGIGRGRDDVVIDPVPFFYLLGLSELLFGTILEGGTVVIIPNFTPRTILETITHEQGTILYGVPAMHNALAMLRDDIIRSYDLSSLRVASTAGAKTSTHLMTSLQEKYEMTLCETYGLSELSVVAMSDLSNHRLGTVGKPLGDLKIIGDEGHKVPPGVIGEAVVRVPWAMKEYYKAPELTREVFKDGWFYTGDSVKIDDDGYVEYIEKKSFIIVTPAGLKISPWEVENLLLSHPAIAEAAYVGTKNSAAELIPTVFVVTREGETTTQEDLTCFCSQYLADFKLPKRIKFVDSIPKTGSGKIDRYRLRDDG